jgi:hypothetical protein
MLEPSNHLAVRLAHDGDPEPFDFKETDTTYTIGWKRRIPHRGPRIRLRQSSSPDASPRSLAIPSPKMRD